MDHVVMNRMMPGPVLARLGRASAALPYPRVCLLACLLACLVAGCGPGPTGAEPTDGRGASESAAGTGATAQSPTAQGPADGGTAGGAAGDTAAWPETIRIGLVPTEGGTDIRERFEPLRTHLSARLGRPVETVSASSYNGVVTAMANDQIEFCYFGPQSYVVAADIAGAEALILEKSIDGGDGYRSILIVPAASEITSLDGARGAVFAFTDPNSTSGYLIPSILLRELTGTDPESFFSEVRFSGNHGTSVQQVALGELGIAATNDLDFNRMVERGAVERDAVRVIYESDPIPGAPWAARRELPADLKEAFVEAMLALNTEPELLERFQNGGFRRTTDGEYDIIRAAQALLEQQKASGAG